MEVFLPGWLPWFVGAVGGLCLGLIWLIALFVLVSRWQVRKQARSTELADPRSFGSPVHSSSSLEPIRSFLEPDEDEPCTPLPSQSQAPLSFNRYVEVRGAIAGWSSSGMDVSSQLGEVFGLEVQAYQDAHQWWMTVLDGADDRLAEIERRAEVFAQRYGGEPP